jgi:hypothetical protein
MRNPIPQTGRSTFTKVLAPLFVALATVFAGGCESPEDSSGTDFNAILLPTDLVLNLACADAGVGFETCILEDPENPFVLVATPEFNSNNPDGFTKFDLANKIPAGPTGAKARYYLWATALARFPSGENQWYTARALFELWDAAADTLIREQALKAYRSVLDNFYGSTTFFEFGPVTLNEQTADDLYRFEATFWRPLIEGGNVAVLERMYEWGYTYIPPQCEGCPGLVTPNGG